MPMHQPLVKPLLSSAPLKAGPQKPPSKFLRNSFQKRSEFVSHLAPLFRRNVVNDNSFAHCRQMIAQHVVLDAAERVNDRRNLMHDVEAISIRLNHSLKSANLSLNAVQTRELPVMSNISTD